MTKTVVIKLGGSILTRLHPNFFTQCALLKQQGITIIIVHGGGALVSEWMKKIGKEPQFVGGYRVTDDDILTITEMVLAGKVNKQIVSQLASVDLSAIGLSGIDLQLVQAKQRNPLLGFVGEVTRVNRPVLQRILKQGWVPVVSSLGIGTDGQHYNINADEVASAIAQTMHADQLIMVSDVDGICIGTGSKRRILAEATPNLIKQYIQSGEISGGMIPKVRSGIEALQRSVNEVWILNGTQPHTLSLNSVVQPFVGTRLCKEVSHHVSLS
jgi:acetylglutamate kinase